MIIEVVSMDFENRKAVVKSDLLAMLISYMYIFDKDSWYGRHAVVIEEITFKLSDDREISVNGRCLDDADTEEISVAIEARYYKGM